MMILIIRIFTKDGGCWKEMWNAKTSLSKPFAASKASYWLNSNTPTQPTEAEIDPSNNTPT